MRLPAREKSLLIDLRCQQALSPCQYEYRLKQEHAVEWKSFTTQVMLHYENLSGNEYVFQVRRANSQPFIEQRIFIENALWQQWWFVPSLFLYTVFMVGIVLFLFFRYRLRQFLRMQLIRDRIARDLHDDMGSYLSSISILSAAMPTDPARARQNLDRIGQTARQVMDAMSDIVWSINPAQDTMQQVLDRMKQVADDLFGTTDTAIQFAVGPGVEALSLPLERRRDFFLIYKEALTNIARYAEAASVVVELERQPGHLRLYLHDNGCGFDLTHSAARSGGGNGLRNMQSRAAGLGGTLLIRSAPGQGTQIELVFPA